MLGFPENSKLQLIVVKLTFCEPCPSTSWLTQDGRTADTQDDSLSVAEHGRDLVAARALDVHEVGVRMLNKSLQLVLAFLILGSRVQQVLSKLKKNLHKMYSSPIKS